MKISGSVENYVSSGPMADTFGGAGNGEPQNITSLAREIQSLFVFQMLKAMRETLSDEGKGLGASTYSSMFDMEFSRLISESSPGMEASLVKQLDARSKINKNNNIENKTEDGINLPVKDGINFQQKDGINLPERSTTGIKFNDPRKKEFLLKQNSAAMKTYGEAAKSNQASNRSYYPQPFPKQQENPSQAEMLNRLNEVSQAMSSQNPRTLYDTKKIIKDIDKSISESIANDGKWGNNLPVADGTISSYYGMRDHPITGKRMFHHGLDIAAAEGSDIHPVRSGRVIFSGEQPGYGNVVIIKHDNGYITKYAHNSENLVSEGDVVDTGTTIATVGKTGDSTGPHVHLEVRHDGKSINPMEIFNHA